MPQQTTKTFCVQASDAENREDSKLTFQLKLDNPRSRAVKVALSSLEFPITQYTIEKEWNRIYFSEGTSLDEETCSMNFSFKFPDLEKVYKHTLDLPNRLNSIKTWTILGSTAIATCELPHCLHLLKDVDWGDVEVLCSPFGRTSLHTMLQDNQLEIISSYKFKIMMDTNTLEVGTQFKEPNAGYLFFPPIPSPYHFCSLLNSAMLKISLPCSFTFYYNQVQNQIIPEVFPQEDGILNFENSLLKNLIGINISQYNLTKSKTNVIPTEYFSNWDYVDLEPGWYSPSHRSYCTGQPLRLSQEVESAFNRLYFPLPERIPEGHITSHFLIFSDPCGHIHSCPVPCGRYTPDLLCSHIEHEMNKLASKTTVGVEFSVEHVNDKYRFSCEINENNKMFPAPFSLLFNHSMQFDPSKLGFSPQPLIGLDTYTSEHKTHFPSLKKNNSKKPSLNIYRISESGHQKKFKLHATTPPILTGVIVKYDKENCQLLIKTYLNQLPYSHGYSNGDVVKLSPAKSNSLYEFDESDESWKEASYEPCSLAPKYGRTGIVLGIQENTNLEMCSIIIKVRKTPQFSSCIGQTLQIHSFIQPFNFCFTLPKSIKPSILGFNKGCLLWGIDGSIESNDFMIPPFQAPNCHNLDHPDYVLMMLDEGKSTQLQHTYKDMNVNAFAKVVLYPLAREVGMMPKDASLVGSTNLSKFTVRFLNPDMTPYHFHGVDFSLSLTLIDVIGGE